MAVFISGGGSAIISFSDVFSENTWEQIIKACQMNRVPDTWLVGDYKNMTINGVEYRIDIIGKNHDTYSDGTGKAPLTFQLHDCYDTEYAMNSTNTLTGGWENSAMRTTHLPAVLKTMPSAVQSSIREVNKLTGINSVIDITADKLFLLSEVEIFDSSSFSLVGEGIQYQYYYENRETVKRNGTLAKAWGTRSPSKTGTESFCVVTYDGYSTRVVASTARGVSFAFCF